MKHILFVLLVVSALVLGSCDRLSYDLAAFTDLSTPVPPPTPTRSPASGKVKLVYQYGPLPSWIELEHLRLTEDVPISFNSSRGWTLIEFVLIPYEGVELFSFEPDPPNYEDKLIGGCYWMDHGSEYEGRNQDLYDTDWVFRTPNYDCPGLQEGTELTGIKMPMAYCIPYATGTLCKKQGFTVLIEEGGTISFSAENTFLPEYRMWLEQVLDYFGGYTNLPAVLQPNYNYTISK